MLKKKEEMKEEMENDIEIQSLTEDEFRKFCDLDDIEYYGR